MYLAGVRGLGQTREERRILDAGRDALEHRPGRPVRTDGLVGALT